MGAPALSSSKSPATSPALAQSGFVGRLLAAMPPLIIISALGAIVFWGHATQWNFSLTRAEQSNVPSTVAPARARPVVKSSAGGVAQLEFQSASDVEAAGIGIAPVWKTALTEQVNAAGEVTFDSTSVARLSARVPGVARRITKAPGDPVRAGEVLALIDAADIGIAKAELQQALVQVRLRKAARDGIIDAKSALSAAALREAEASLKESQVRLLAAAQVLANVGLSLQTSDYLELAPADVAKRLRYLGVEEDVKALAPSEASAGLYPIRSPFAGVLLSADVAAGEVVEGGKPLLVVADPSRVWITLHIGALDSQRARVGQQVFFRPDGESGEYPGRVVWIANTVDETTRTVTVRAEAVNPKGTLRASTLGRGRLVFREAQSVLVVPNDSVHRFRGDSIVFVRAPDFLKPNGPKVFSVRVVTTGGRDDRNTEILSGLTSGEIVATTRSVALLNELGHAATGH